ncbi:uncharacterized protein LOC133339688 [Lethenteron reissneri]|uniref:uncharacterized protein LOC133339688 n=1 Tax=Lethenteron reissneri TaxID=7753 RepID=UPI002AB6F444|nr:uncharacterized protein LOC133339688 [Lethenteron reissneri]
MLILTGVAHRHLSAFDGCSDFRFCHVCSDVSQTLKDYTDLGNDDIHWRCSEQNLQERERDSVSSWPRPPPVTVPPPLTRSRRQLPDKVEEEEEAAEARGSRFRAKVGGGWRSALRRRLSNLRRRMGGASSCWRCGDTTKGDIYNESFPSQSRISRRPSPDDGDGSDEEAEAARQMRSLVLRHMQARQKFHLPPPIETLPGVLPPVAAGRSGRQPPNRSGSESDEAAGAVADGQRPALVQWYSLPMLWRPPGSPRGVDGVGGAPAAPPAPPPSRGGARAQLSSDEKQMPPEKLEPLIPSAVPHGPPGHTDNYPAQRTRSNVDPSIFQRENVKSLLDVACTSPSEESSATAHDGVVTAMPDCAVTAVMPDFSGDAYS